MAAELEAANPLASGSYDDGGRVYDSDSDSNVAGKRADDQIIVNRESAWSRKQIVGAVFGPLCLLISVFPSIDEEYPKANAMLGITCLTVSWWISECVPLGIASLMPFILIPFFGIERGTVVANTYMNWIVFLFIGSFLIGKGMERTNLHKRIATMILSRVGGSPRLLLFAFMFIAWGLSMVASNTATTAMLLPFVTGVLDRKTDHHDENGDQELNELEDSPQKKKNQRTRKRFGKGVLIGVAYGATCGGIATPTGTVPNALMIGFIKSAYGFTISFAQFVSFGFPVSITMLLIAFSILSYVYVPISNIDAIQLDSSIFKEAAKRQGRMSQDEKVVAIVELLLLFLWFSRPYILGPNIGKCTHSASSEFECSLIDEFSSSWISSTCEINVSTEAECKQLSGTSWTDFIDDGGLACLAASILFFVPAKTYPGRILQVRDLVGEKGLPWDLFLLFGAAFAISLGWQESGLTLVFGETLSLLSGVSLPALVFLIAFLVCFTTEIVSNTATTQIMLTILGPVAINLGVNPLLLMLTSTIAASLAFMLPLSTPPNALVFSTGRLRFTDMIKVGFVLNLLGVVAVTFWVWFLAPSVFDIDIDVLPDWAIDAADSNTSQSCYVFNNTAFLVN